MNKLLMKLYHYAPRILKPRILNIIVSKEGGQMYSESLRQIYAEYYGIYIGYGSYGGCFNLDNKLPSGVSFGNYCSIASNIRIFRANHPKNTFTSHPLLYNPVAGYVTRDMLSRPLLEIGHDVWIGEWVVILPNVSLIGNGAIIGAGSIITKNVEPYSIVVGNPGKKIGNRFSEHVINKLESTKWWNLKKDNLISQIEALNNLVKND